MSNFFNFWTFKWWQTNNKFNQSIYKVNSSIHPTQEKLVKNVNNAIADIIYSTDYSLHCANETWPIQLK